MKNKYLNQMKTRILFPLMVAILTLMSSTQIMAQTYCVPTYTNSGSSWGIGMQDFTFGTISHTYTPFSPVAAADYYRDNTGVYSTAHSPGSTVNYSWRSGTTNRTQMNIWIDLDRNGTFSVGNGELIYSSGTSIPNNTITNGSWQIPASLAPGTYRVRMFSNNGNSGVWNNDASACASSYTGQCMDFTLLVMSPNLDVMAVSATDEIQIGDNDIEITFANVTAGQNITSVQIGYSLNGGTPVTQNVTGINMTPGSALSRTFTQKLNVSTPGNYELKIWVRNPNGAGAGINNNDTITLTQKVCYPMNGTYTINPNGSGGSNYVNFADAIADLQNCGVDGAVEFIVSVGTFTEQVDIPAIPGASSSNTVVFRGASKSSTILTFGGQTTDSRHTLRFNTSSYVTFRDMTIRSTSGSWGWTVHFYGNGVSNNSVRNVNVECLGTGTSSNFIAILFSNSTSSYSTNITASYNVVDSCLVDGGWTNYCFYGNTSLNVTVGNVLSNSTLRNAYQYGVYGYYWSEVKMMYNTITPRNSGSYTTGSYGVYLVGSNTQHPFRHEIVGNRVFNFGTYGFYLSSLNSSSGNRGLFANNSVGGDFTTTSTAYGVYSSYTSWMNYYHNSVNMNNNASTIYGWYFQNSANQFNQDFRNNMTQVTGTGSTLWALYADNSTMFSDMDYNNFVVKNGANLIFMGTGFTSANFKGGAFWNQNSYNLESAYTSSTNLRYSNGCIRGFPFSNVQVDINGNARSLQPNVGCHEFANTATNDIGVISIVSPSGTITPGQQNLVVRLKNYGSNVVTSAQVSYTHNNGTPVTISWTGTLQPCGEVNVTFSGTNQITIVGGVNNIRAYTSSPNGLQDSESGNDATSSKICPAMSGTFTIDPNSNALGNFKSFTDAVDALNCAGLNGPVTFNVAAGTYVEQVALTSIPGSSATNTITFDGGAGNAATRVLFWSTTTNTERHTFRIDNTSHVFLKNISITGSNTSWAWPLHVMGSNITNIQVENCVIALTGAAASSTSSNLIPVVVSNSTTSYSTGFTFTNINFDNCDISGGYFGMTMYGNGTSCTGNRVVNSRLTNAYYYGTYYISLGSFEFVNNKLHMRQGNANGYGMMMQSVNASGSNNIKVIKNEVLHAGYCGIYMSSCNNNGPRGEFVNNTVSGLLSPSAQAVYMSSCSNWDFYHNSINVDVLLTSTTATAYYTSSCTNLNMRNNVFALTHPSLNNGSIYPVYHANNHSGLICDYNNYFKYGTTSDFVRINGSIYNATDFKGGGGFNVNSYFEEPGFVSNYDLHTNIGCRTGTVLSSVTDDIDGDTRSGNPTIGADEGRDLDAAIEILSPTGTSIGTTANFQVRVTNAGKDAINSYQVALSVNGGTPTTQNGGALASCGNNTFNFNSVSIPSTGLVSVAAYLVHVNNGVDQNRMNDTSSRAYCNGPLSGTYTVNPTSGAPRNFPDINTVMAVMQGCGLAGDVKFEVAAATFTSQMYFNPSQISGLANYRVEFEGVDSASSIVTFNSGGYTLRLDGADNMTFRRMGFHNTGSSSAFTVHLTNQADNNIFENCHISAPAISNTTVIPFGIMGTGYNSSGVNWGQNNLVNNCKIEGGYITVNLYGGSSAILSQRNKVHNSHISGATTYGTYIYYQQESEFVNNFITCPGSYVMYYSYCPTSILERNYIYGGSSYGVYMTQVSPNTTFARGRVVNNMIGGQTGTGTVYGLYNINTYNMDFWHNTILMSNTSTSGRAFHNSSGSNNSLINNILVSEASNGYAAYFSTNNTFPNVDYNNYFVTNAPNVVYTWGTNHIDLNSLKSFNATQNQNSVSLSPNFVSWTGMTPDLHLTANIQAPAGDNTLGVTVDIDNDERCISAKTIGADQSEYVEAVTARFTAPDTVFIQSPFTAINADAPGANRSYQWDFNNDGSIEFTTLNATYAFSTPGVKQIKLRTLSCNGVDSFIQSVVVVIPSRAPEADFIVDRHVTGPLPDFVTLQDLSTNGATSWEWTITPNPNNGVFYDPYAQNPEVYFSDPGTYTVCLEATNVQGTSPQKCKTQYITVQDVNSMCLGKTNSTAASGEIYDSGGPTGPYGTSENCYFLIEPCAASVTLKFTEFNLANTAHVLRIYNGRDATAPLIGTYSSTSGLPGGTNGVTANSGAMYLTWTTNTVGQASGFAATWTSQVDTNSLFSVGFDMPDSAFVMQNVNFINQSIGSGMTYSWDFDGDFWEDATDRDGSFVYSFDGTYYPSLSVSDACGNSMTVTDTIVIVVPSSAPVADFEADVRVATTNDVVKFTDLSTNGPIGWTWSITPNTYVNAGGNTRDPWFRFTDTGMYEVTLDATNAAGTGSVTKTAYIRVIEYCTAGASELVPDLGINKVILNNMSNTSSSGQSAFTSYFNDQNVGAAVLDAGGTYDLQVARNTALNRMNRKAWIDYNADGDFDDAGELIGFETANTNTTWTLNFTVPVSAIRGATRMRIGAAFADSTNVPCGTNFYGEVEEYRIVINDDITPPTITLIGNATEYVELAGSYTDAGATAHDAVDGNLTSSIVVTNNLNVNVAGTYQYRYNVQDAAGNAAEEVVRTVIVNPDITPPVLQLASPTIIVVPLLSTFAEPGYSAMDAISGNVTASVTIDRSAFDSTKVGEYKIVYVASDAFGNRDTAIRTVFVIDNIAPVITLNGNDPMEVEVFTTFNDPGVSVSDNYDLVVNAVVSSNVNTNVLGSYTILYEAKDAAGNVTSLTRTVNVVDNTAPVLMVANTDTITVEVFGQLVLPGRSASDNYDPKPTITISGNANTSVLGTYTVSLQAEDASGNQSNVETLVVVVVDTKAPVITLNGSYLTTVNRWSTFTDPGVTITDNYYTGLTATVGGNFVNTATVGLYYITYNVTDGSGNVAAQVTRAVNVVDVDETTGLGNMEGVSMNMYPNPANSVVTLSFEGNISDVKEVRLINNLGQVVLVKNWMLGQSEMTIDVSAILPGVYYVQVEHNGSLSMEKLIVTK